MLSTGGRPEGIKRDVADLKRTAFPENRKAHPPFISLLPKRKSFSFNERASILQNTASLSMVGTVNQATETAGWKSSHLYHWASTVTPIAFHLTGPQWV